MSAGLESISEFRPISKTPEIWSFQKLRISSFRLWNFGSQPGLGGLQPSFFLSTVIYVGGLQPAGRSGAGKDRDCDPDEDKGGQLVERKRLMEDRNADQELQSRCQILEEPQY